MSLGLVGSINRVKIQKYKTLGAVGDVGRVSSSSQSYRIKQSSKENKKSKKQNKKILSRAYRSSGEISRLGWARPNPGSRTQAMGWVTRSSVTCTLGLM